MKRLIPCLLLAGLMFACNKEEISEQLNEKEASDPVEEIQQTENNEYFNAVVDSADVSTDFIAEDPEYIAADYFTNPESGITSLTIYGTTSESDSKTILFMLCFYDGAGTYHTGTNMTNSYAYYWGGNYIWYCDPGMGDPGTVTISFADKHFVEGSFNINNYSYEPEMSEKSIRISGEFGANINYLNN